MTEQTPQDAYVESCLIDLSKKLTEAEKRINQLEAFMHEIIDEAKERSFSAEEKVRAMKKLARRALGEEK